MGLEQIRWKANERVGLPDQEAIGDLVLEEMNRFQGEMFLQESTGPRVLGGFGLTDLGGGGLARLDAGRAILSIQKDQVLSHGYYLGAQSPTSYQLDFSGAADDTYNVYIRGVYSDGTFENRVFWNPGSSAEYVDYTATRRLVLWETTYVSDSSPSPGDEWLLVWSVDVASGLITGTTDERPLFFEGPANDTYSHEWGDGANDRNANRATYGVTDLWTFAQAARRQIADIIGDAVGAHTFWAEAPIELTQLASEHWAESDGASQRGKHKDLNFGATGRFWNLSTSSASSWERMAFTASEEATSTPRIEFALGDTGGSGERYGLIRVQPYGSAITGPVETGDQCGIEWWGTDGLAELVNNTATGMNKKWWFGATEYLSLDETGTYQGLSLLVGSFWAADYCYAGDGFFLPSAKSVYVSLPWSSMLTDTSGSFYWSLQGPSDGDVGDTPVWVSTIGTISGAKPCYFEFSDFPDGATLLAIDICWSQSVATATTEMRMFAGRHRMAATRPSDTHDASQDVTGNPFTYQALHSTQNYVEYVLDVQTTQVRRFKPNQNNDSWNRRKDKLVIGIMPPDDSATACYIYDIRTLWTYDAASPWPLTEGW